MNLFKKIKVNISNLLIEFEGDADFNLSKQWQSYLIANNNKPDIKFKVSSVKKIRSFNNFNKKFNSTFWKLLTKEDKNAILIGEDGEENTTAEYIFTKNGKPRVIANFETTNKQIKSFYPIDELIIASLLSNMNGMTFHASAVIKNRSAFLFAGSSGMGKSTISKLFDKRNITVLSDDRVIVRRENNLVKAYGTPWHGDAMLYSAKNAPLKKIFFLKHGKKNEIKSIDRTHAAALLVVRSFPPYWDAERMHSVLSLCTELAQMIPCYELYFKPNDSIVDFVLNLDNK